MFSTLYGSSLAIYSKFTARLSVLQKEINYQARTPGEPIGIRTRLKDVNNTLVTSRELLKIIDRILAQNDQLASSMSLFSALHSELERACLQVNQLLKEQRSQHREMSDHLVKCFAEERASYDNKQQQAVESGELEAERKLRCQYESLNSKLERELAETKIAFINTTKKLESEKKARKRTEQVCHELASEISHKESEREREILQLSGKLGGKKINTKRSECKDQFDERNGVVEKLRNQFEAFFKSKKSEKTSCNKITTYPSRSHCRSNKNEERECGEVGDSSAESDLHSIELNMDNKRGSSKWTRASSAARDVIPSDDEMRARKYISEIVPRKSSYIQGRVSDGFHLGSYTRTMPSSVSLLQQERFHGRDQKSQRKVDKCELLRHKSVEDLKDKMFSSSSLGSGGEITSPIQEWEHPLHSQYFGHAIEEKTRSTQRRSTKLRLEGNRSRTKLYSDD